MLQEFDLEIRDNKGIGKLVADRLFGMELEMEDDTSTPINERFLDEQLFALLNAHAPLYVIL